MSNLLKVAVHTPEGIVFETECFGISSTNFIGNFDVLVEHENYITQIIKPVKILDEKLNVVEELPMDMGVLQVEDNKVKIFAIISSLIKSSER